VDIERFDPAADEQQLRACHAMAAAGQPADDPNVPPMSLSWFRGWWAFGFADNPMQAWLATDDSGEPVGGYLLELPEKENRGNAFGFVIVNPSRRRRGIGTTLLAHMAGRSARAGRALLLSATRVGGPGSAFASATGAGKGILDVRRRLDVDAGLRARLAGLRAGAERHAMGYSLRSWQGMSPHELADGLCAVFTALGDAPHDEIFEPEVWDPARLRAAEERVRLQGTRWYSVAALAPDAQVAAITQVNVDPCRPDWGWQEITAVTRPHRGHRLGLLVKVAMLELLAEHEPGLRRIMTYNAEQNEHMIAVNEQLGYVVSDYFQCWDHDIARAASLA
jgi:RimJ/RimL family protein N-acetyltransferase